MKFLVFQHVPHEHLGLISDFAADHDLELAIVKLWQVYQIPSISNFDALIIMGGPMGVYEDKKAYPSKDEEVEVIQEAIGKIPILGFCLGSQLLAYALGAKVYPNQVSGKQVKEIGFYDIDLTESGKTDPLFQGFSETFQVLEWHGDAFDLPSKSKRLATSPLCINQAFVYKNAYGLLFHFEFTPEMIAQQIEIDKAWIHTDHELDEAKLLEEARKNAVLMKKQCDQLLTNFLKTIKSQT